MKPTEINYSKVFSLGNYENEKIGVVIKLEENNDPEKAIQKAKLIVENAHERSKEVSKALNIIRHPELTDEVVRAKKLIGIVNDPDDLPF